MYHKWLQAFHAVAREGGFTAAARSLNLGQPTISIHVKALEQQFGVELFDRQGRTVKLTPLGRSLLKITQGLYGHERGCRQTFALGATTRGRRTQGRGQRARLQMTES